MPGSEKKACANCFCYVCDISAAKCSEWSEHCKATHKSAYWKAQREAYKAHGGKPPAPASSSARGPSSSTSLVSPETVHYRRLSREERTRWSAEYFLKQIEQVYPVEEPEPAGFAEGVQLRPYQRQSLAFMLANEASSESRLAGIPHGAGMKRYHHQRVRGGWLADEMGASTARQTRLSARARPTPELPPLPSPCSPAKLVL